MKLRFRKNSLRLRVNQREVEGLAAGVSLEEEVHFPGNERMSYVLETTSQLQPSASFKSGTIRVLAPELLVNEWAAGQGIGLYFDLPANGSALHVAIEKDLECVDGTPEERDAHAFPRAGKTC